MALNLTGTPTLNPQRVKRWARNAGCKNPDDLDVYIDTLFSLYAQYAPFDPPTPDALIPQSAHETANLATPQVPWASWNWSEELNPAGIGITGDPTQNAESRVFQNGRDAAYAHFIHAWQYVKGSVLPPGLDSRDDPRWQAGINAKRHLLFAKTTADFEWTWAEDGEYAEKIDRWARRMRDAGLYDVEGSVPETPGGNTVALKAHKFVGLDKLVYLPDTITVKIDIVPANMIGWVRSGVNVPFSEIDYVTFHDTGTPGSTAQTQRNYLHNGPMGRNSAGQLVRRQVGFNFAVDDKMIIQLTPLNEVTWAAGTALGNRTSWHVEQCFGGAINWEKSLANAIALHAGLLEVIDDPVDTTLVKHQKWYGKTCPAQVMNRGLWPTVLVRAKAGVDLINAHQAAGGDGTGGGVPTEPTPTPVYPAPSPIAELAEASKNTNTAPAITVVNGTRWVAVFDRVRAIKDTPRLQYAHKDSKHVGPLIKAGETFDVTHIGWEVIDGVAQPAAYRTPFDTRVWVADTARTDDDATEPNAEGADTE